MNDLDYYASVSTQERSVSITCKESFEQIHVHAVSIHGELPLSQRGGGEIFFKNVFLLWFVHMDMFS